MAWTVAIGVDTHKDAHVAVALDVLGAELDHCVVEATLAGYKRLLSWAALLGEPAFAVEGCGQLRRGPGALPGQPRLSGVRVRAAPPRRSQARQERPHRRRAWRPVVCSQAAG